MYRNQATLQVDEKGRIRLPTGFAETLGVDTLIVTLHHEYHLGQYVCLVMYDLAKWEVLEQRIERLQNNDIHKQLLENNFLGCAEECQIKSGKILLPSLLRDKANILPKSTILMQSIGGKQRLWNLDNKQQFDDYIYAESRKASGSDGVNHVPF